MNHGRIFRHILWIACFCFSSCSPIHQLNCLLEHHPHLFDRFKSDTIFIDSGKSIDTFFITTSETDTFYINSGIRIERSRDTFRFVYRERNCTTYIEKTEIRPTTKVIEREIRKEVNKERNKEIFRLSLYVLLALLVTGLIRYIFKK